MPFVQRNESGYVISQFANRQPGYAEEWIDDTALQMLALSSDQLASIERAWRDRELSEVRWLWERHQGQLEIDVGTSIDSEQFKTLLIYMQALRDWPQSPDFPDNRQRPIAPPWITELTQ